MEKTNLKELNEKVGYEEEKPKLLLDGDGRSMSDLSNDIVDILKDKNILFYRPTSRQIVEIGNVKYHNKGKKLHTGFINTKDKRFITLLEKFAKVGHLIGKYKEFEIKSLSPHKSDIVLQSHILEEALPQIERIFEIPLPIKYKEELTFPKKGYDVRFNSWRLYDSPEIEFPEMNLEEAKQIIDKIYSEFCFKSNQDKTNAISGLLTPVLRGLFKEFNTITPAFFYLGNREGVGKDYCKGVTSIIMEGQHRGDNPICDGGSANNSDELRKKITSAFRNGRKSMHFANNRGYLNSGVLEEFISSPMWIDRILGKNEEVTFPNEMEKSLSGNIPIRWTPDFGRRAIFIHLFYSSENILARKFKKEDLHGWVLENRGKILSALYYLVRNWIEKVYQEHYHLLLFLNGLKSVVESWNVQDMAIRVL